MMTRRGLVDQVLVGSGRHLSLDGLKKIRVGPRLLRGVRLLETHLANELLSQEELTHLALHRFDYMVGLGVGHEGLPTDIHLAHLLPPNTQQRVQEIFPPVPLQSFSLDCRTLVDTLEGQMARAAAGQAVENSQETAMLISASNQARATQEEHLAELAELVKSADGRVLGSVVQRTHHPHPKYLLGSGKLQEVIINALQRQATMLVFDQTLTPAQVRAISAITEMKVVDRTQIILDIFARRAHSREGKVQVELAQCNYLLPRLSGRHTALSRLGGGIGGRGPGETKLETDRRRIRDRISHLERALTSFARHQQQRRARRVRNKLPVISIVGYTNAGKSTLLNALTNSHVSTQNRPFETLDTTTRRLRFPQDREVILTDTVGFIRDLPRELMGAFRTTLEELQEADLMLHLVDVSSPEFAERIKTVEAVLAELHLEWVPQVLVFNKGDRLPLADSTLLCRRFGAIGISALEPDSLRPLIERLQQALAHIPFHSHHGTRTSGHDLQPSVAANVGLL